MIIIIMAHKRNLIDYREMVNDTHFFVLRSTRPGDCGINVLSAMAGSKWTYFVGQQLRGRAKIWKCVETVITVIIGIKFQCEDKCEMSII